MATYAELLEAAQHEGLRNKIRVAVVVAAETIRTELDTVPQHAARLAWAKRCFESPDAAAASMIWPVLAQNKAATLVAITGAPDATVQAAVDAAVNVFTI